MGINLEMGVYEYRKGGRVKGYFLSVHIVEFSKGTG